MFRLVTARRLRQLEATILARDGVIGALERDLVAGRTKVLMLEAQLFDAKQSAAKWEKRAERFIDQIGIASGTLASPAMAEPAAPAGDAVKGIFAALGVKEMRRVPIADGPGTSDSTFGGSILGVDAAAAADAIAGVFTS